MMFFLGDLDKSIYLYGISGAESQMSLPQTSLMWRSNEILAGHSF